MTQPGEIGSARPEFNTPQKTSGPDGAGEERDTERYAMTLKMQHGRQALSLAALLAVLASTAATLGTAKTASAAGCGYPAMSQVFLPWADVNNYFMAPGANFEKGLGGWSASGGASVVTGNEPHNVGGTGSHSLALPTTSATATTPVFCVSVDAPTFRVLVKNNGNLGMYDGQLVVYLNFQNTNGTWQQVKIAAVKMSNTNWNLTLPISFIQYISTPLAQNGYANVSFTFHPNDNHGNWQIDDMYVDPCKSH